MMTLVKRSCNNLIAHKDIAQNIIARMCLVFHCHEKPAAGEFIPISKVHDLMRQQVPMKKNSTKSLSAKSDFDET